jgi:hypothetical protein
MYATQCVFLSYAGIIIQIILISEPRPRFLQSFIFEKQDPGDNHAWTSYI